MARRLLVVACLVLCLGNQAVWSACPDVEEEAEDVKNCRDGEWGQVIKTDDITENTDACSRLQETIDCIVDKADGCPELEANYLATAMYPWAMTSDALGCKTTFKVRQNVEFENGNCSFYQVYKCHKELFDLMYIQPETAGDPVAISNLKTWLTAKTQLLEERDSFCKKYMKGVSQKSSKQMSKCAEDLKKNCQKLLPMNDVLPEKPIYSEEDPYTMMEEVKELANKLCVDECADMAKKEKAAKACGGEDLNTVKYDIETDKNRTSNCEALKTARDCMITELNNCPYLVEKLEESVVGNLTKALKLCKLDVHLGSSKTTGAAGLVVSLTVLVMALLCSAM